MKRFLWHPAFAYAVALALGGLLLRRRESMPPLDATAPLARLTPAAGSTRAGPQLVLPHDLPPEVAVELCAITADRRRTVCARMHTTVQPLVLDLPIDWRAVGAIVAEVWDDPHGERPRISRTVTPR